MIIKILQIIVSILLIIVILLQQRGGGLSSVFGSETFYGSRRGVEKFIFISSIILAICFLAVGIANILIK